MNFQDYIKPELLVLIPVLYLIGMGIKRMELKDKFIPLILGVIGVLSACAYVLATEDTNGGKAVLLALFTAFTQGVLCAGASVYVNQIIKQANKGE